jgi:hypothetical protein
MENPSSTDGSRGCEPSIYYSGAFRFFLGLAHILFVSPTRTRSAPSPLTPTKTMTNLATITASSSSSSSQEKKVQFGDLTILEFHKVLDDTPACSSGPAVRLGDELVSTSTRNIELYEFLKAMKRAEGESSASTSSSSESSCTTTSPSRRHSPPPHRRRRRTSHFCLSPQQRIELFVDAGYKTDDIAMAIMASQKGRNQRQESLQHQQLLPLSLLKWDRFSAMLEGTAKKYHPPSMKALLNGMIGTMGSGGGGATAAGSTTNMSNRRKTDMARSA